MPASGYKLFATGDVLTAADVNNYLMLQTVMVFANSGARTTALSGVLAEGLVSYLQDTNVVEVYTGAAWVSLDDPNAVQNASYYAAGKNAVINSAFNVWQRGTSVSVAASTTAYTSDRFQFITGASQACTVARQSTNDTTNLSFIQYCARVQRNSGQTGTSALIFGQAFETATSIPFAGRTVTYSFYARAGANFSAASSALTAYLIGGTGTDQALTGFTGATVIIGSTATLTTTWQRFTFSAAVASTYTQLGVRLDFTPVGTASTNDYYEVTGIQLEASSAATAFQTASGTIGGELALCQRYYVRLGASAAYDNYGSGGFGISTTVAQMAFPLPVQMRITPTSVDYANLSLYNSGFTAVTSFALGSGLTATPQTAFGQSTVASGLTQYRNYWLTNNNLTTAYIGFSAEL